MEVVRLSDILGVDQSDWQITSIVGILVEHNFLMVIWQLINLTRNLRCPKFCDFPKVILLVLE